MSAPGTRYDDMDDEELVAELRKRAGEITGTLKEIHRILKEASNVE